jgi:glycosyltransferase involved in cell wall biosynthesis
MRRVLVNAATLRHGGALQVAKWFIERSLDGSPIDYSYLVSPAVAEALREDVLAHPQLTVVERSPARSLRARHVLRHQVGRQRPDVVYSVFGPAYVEMPTAHVMGMAQAWLIPSARAALNRPASSLVRWCRRELRYRYYLHWFRMADRWIAEADWYRKALATECRFSAERISVVPNGFNDEVFGSTEPHGPRFPGPDEEWVAVYVAHGYEHKNHSVIPDLLVALRDGAPQIKLRVVLTLDAASAAILYKKARQLGVDGAISNVGIVKPSGLPALYSQADLALVPTLLEVSSACYPEAFRMGLPVITSDLPFARESCGDAAIYCDPRSPKSIAAAVKAVVSSSLKPQDLRAAGLRRARLMTSPELRFKMIEEILLAG